MVPSRHSRAQARANFAEPNVRTAVKCLDVKSFKTNEILRGLGQTFEWLHPGGEKGGERNNHDMHHIYTHTLAGHIHSRRQIELSNFVINLSSLLWRPGPPNARSAGRAHGWIQSKFQNNTVGEVWATPDNK